MSLISCPFSGSLPSIIPYRSYEVYGFKSFKVKVKENVVSIRYDPNSDSDSKNFAGPRFLSSFEVGTSVFLSDIL